jgi:hypothetical protein
MDSNSIINMCADVHPFEIDHLIMNDIGPFVPATGLHRLGTYVGKEMRFRSSEELAAYVRRIAAQFGPLTDEEWDKIIKYYVRPIQGGTSPPARVCSSCPFCKSLAMNCDQNNRLLPAGGEFAYELHYDPAIAASIPSDPSKFQDIDLWKYWEHVKCGSLLLLRGCVPLSPSPLRLQWSDSRTLSTALPPRADSDILPRHVADEMVKRARFPMRIHEFPGVGHAPPLLNDEQVQVVRHFLLSGPAAEE